MVLRMIQSDHEHGLADYESPVPEKPRHPLREPPERVGVVSGAHLRAARNGWIGPTHDGAGRPPPSSLPSCASPEQQVVQYIVHGNRAEQAGPSSSHTATLIRL